MKTNNVISKIVKVMALISMTVMLANCSKNNSNGTTTAVAGAYQLVNGVCYQMNNGQTVAQVNYSLCAKNYNSGLYLTQVCSGPHSDGVQTVNCGTQFNCAGYTLYNSQTGQIVRCQ